MKKNEYLCSNIYAYIHLITCSVSPVPANQSSKSTSPPLAPCNSSRRLSIYPNFQGRLSSGQEITFSRPPQTRAIFFVLCSPVASQRPSVCVHVCESLCVPHIKQVQLQCLITVKQPPVRVFVGG